MIADALYIAFGYKLDESSMRKAEGGIERIGGKLKTVAVAATAVLAPAALAKYASDKLMEASLTADVAAKEARRIGITTEALQEFEYAAGKSGVKAEELRAGMTKLGAKFSQAAKGDAKDLQKVFRELNLDYRALADQSPDAQFTAVAEAISKIPNAGDRARLSMKLLEEQGPKFASMFAGGAAAINAMRQEARDLGLIISDEDAQRAEVFNDSLSAVQQTGQAIARSFFIDLIPVLQEFLTLFQDFQTSGLRQNKFAVKEFAAEVKALLRILLDWLKSTLELYKSIGGLTGAIKLMAIVVASAAAAYVLLSAAGGGVVATNLAILASGLAAVAPYALLAGFIGLVLLALDDLRGWIEGEDSLLGDVFGEYSEDTLLAIQAALIGIGVVLAVLLGGTLGIVALLALAAAGIFIFWDDIVAFASDAFDMIIKGWIIIWEKSKEGMQEFADWVVGLWDRIVTSLQEKWSSFVDFIKLGIDTITKPLEDMRAKFDGIGGDIRGLIGVEPQPTAEIATRAGRLAATRQANQLNTGPVTVTVDASGMTPDEAQGAVAGGLSDGLLRVTNDAFDDSDD